MLRPWLMGFLALGLGVGSAVAQNAPPPTTQTPPASSDDTPQEPPVATVDDVLVVGGALEKLAENFVTSLAAPARRRGLARWEGEVCLGVVNFRAGVAHLIIDRITDVARELEMELGEPGCEPNVVIAGTTDASRLARDMVGRYRSNFFRYGYTSSNRGSAALEAFQTSDAPVRWWHVSLPIVVETGAAAIRLPGRGPVEAHCRTRSGYWARNCDEVTDRIMRMITIVDIDGLENVNLAELADYLALITLAQVEPDADYSGFDTVLNLFDPAIAVSGLTDWDMIYLRALYSGEAEHLTAAEQADRMVSELREPPARD
ncbi:MAG: hypothetical protein U1E24_15175 [Phenylobacterium sp.]|nr:hypothetical protein [Phenylobacterium sp.]